MQYSRFRQQWASSCKLTSQQQRQMGITQDFVMCQHHSVLVSCTPFSHFSSARSTLIILITIIIIIIKGTVGSEKTLFRSLYGYYRVLWSACPSHVDPPPQLLLAPHVFRLPRAPRSLDHTETGRHALCLSLGFVVRSTQARDVWLNGHRAQSGFLRKGAIPKADVLRFTSVKRSLCCDLRRLRLYEPHSAKAAWMTNVTA